MCWQLRPPGECSPPRRPESPSQLQVLGGRVRGGQSPGRCPLRQTQGRAARHSVVRERKCPARCCDVTSSRGCLPVGGWGPARAPPAHSAWLGRDRAWTLSPGTRCLAAGLPLPAPKSGLDAPTTPPRSQVGLARLPRGLRDGTGAGRPQETLRPAGQSTSGSHSDGPKVITFPATRRKSLVRCGFPHFPSRLRNQSLSFHQPPCHRSVLLGRGHRRALPCFPERVAGAQGGHTVPLSHLPS